MENKQIVGYCRVSTEEQKKKGFGIKIQVRAIKKFAKDNDITVDRIFKEQAVSGIEENRKELNKVLDLCEKGKVKAVIFPSTDRPARSLRFSENLYYELNRCGVRIYFTDMPYYDPDNEDDVFTRQVNEAAAEKERKKIIKRLQKGRQERTRIGLPPGGTVPYGYTRKNKKWKINHYESGIIKLIFELARCEEKAFKIAQTLNTQGLKRRNNKEWTGQQVIKILGQKELYQNGMVHYGGIIGQNKKLIILTDD